jgi:hypothetical protein
VCRSPGPAHDLSIGLQFFGNLRIRLIAAITDNHPKAGAGSMVFYASSSEERLQASQVGWLTNFLYILDREVIVPANLAFVLRALRI